VLYLLIFIIYLVYLFGEDIEMECFIFIVLMVGVEVRIYFNNFKRLT